MPPRFKRHRITYNWIGQVLRESPVSVHLFAWRTATTAGLADDAELLFRKAVLHRRAAQPAEAESCWRRVLALKRPEQFCNINQGIYGHLTLRNLAVLAEERGDPGEAAALGPGPGRVPWGRRGNRQAGATEIHGTDTMSA